MLINETLFFVVNNNIRPDPNSRSRQRRISKIEQLHNQKKISPKQKIAADVLSVAYDETQKTHFSDLSLKVDCSPSFGSSMEIGLQRQWRLAKLMNFIPADTKQIVRDVVCYNLPVGGAGGRQYNERLKTLCFGLDHLAISLKI